MIGTKVKVRAGVLDWINADGGEIVGLSDVEGFVRVRLDDGRVVIADKSSFEFPKEKIFYGDFGDEGW